MTPSPRAGLHPRTPPDLLDTIIVRLALHNCLAGLRAHRRCPGCRDCAGWRRFIAAAGRAVRL